MLAMYGQTYISKWHELNVSFLFQVVDQMYTACDELLNSQMLVLVLEYILAIGNHLNRNWSEHNISQGFQITSLDKVGAFFLYWFNNVNLQCLCLVRLLSANFILMLINRGHFRMILVHHV